MDIGKRVKEERKKMGLKLQELSKMVGFQSYQTLSAIEKGARPVKVSELEKIARALGLTVSYLLGGEEKRQEKVLWRKCNNEIHCKKYENLLITFCKNYKKLSELIGHKYEKFIPPKPDELQKERFKDDYEFARDLAEKYRKELDLGRYPGNNLTDALQEKNILIFCFDLGNFGSAASLVGEFGAAILLNKNDRPWRRTFDISHELFHIITWNIYNPEEVYDDERGKSKPEKYADEFAASLLLPMESLLYEIGKPERRESLNIIDIIRIATKFRVSIQALTYRLQNLQIYSAKDMEEIRNLTERNNLNKFMRSKEADLPVLPEIYVNQALKTYQQGRLSKLKLAEYLDVDYIDMNDFLKKYSYPDVEELNIEDLPT